MKKPHSVASTLLLLLGLAQGCGTLSSKPHTLMQEEERYLTPTTIQIDLRAGTNKEVSVDQLIEKVSYLELDTCAAALLAYIAKIRVLPNNIYVCDSKGQLKCFDRAGRFLRAGYVAGRGPKEVVNFYDFDADDRFLYVLDGARADVVVFDHDGTFIKRLQLPFRAHSLQKRDRGWWVALAPFGIDNKEQADQMALTDSLFNVQCSYFRYPTGPIIGRPVPFENKLHASFFTPAFGHGIYKLEGDSLQMQYWLDLGDDFPQSENVEEKNRYAAEHNLWYAYANPLSNDTHLLMPFYTSPEQQGLLVVDLKTHQSLFINNQAYGHRPDLLAFDWVSSVVGYDELSNSFFGPIATTVLENIDTEARLRIEQAMPLLPDSLRHILIKEREEQVNQLLVFITLKSDLTDLFAKFHN